MNSPLPRYELTLDQASRIMTEHLATYADCNAATKSMNRSVAESFLQEGGHAGTTLDGRLVWDTASLVRWMIRDCQGRRIRTASQRLGALARYLRTVHCAGLTSTDLMADFRAAHHGCSWEVIAAAMQSSDPVTALLSLESPSSPPPGPLRPYIQRYLELHESLGKQYRAPRGALLDLDRHLCRWGVCSAQAVDATLIQRWVATMTCTATVRIHKTRFVRRFFNYLEGLQIVSKNPLGPARFVEARQDPVQFRPFIFRPEQVAAVLAHVEQLPPSHTFPLRGPTCHTMLALLYALGLRHGEARRLRIADVDLDQGILQITQTKFHKSRLVPFGPKLGLRLRRYLEQRRGLFRTCDDHDPLFVTYWPRPMSLHTLMAAFRAGLLAAGITSSHGTPLPRLHDLRHSFAVHSLLRWYQQGVDAQSRLPILATFMGHVEATSTQVYLSITLDLLQEASQRFHRHCGNLFDGEVRP